MAKKNKEADFYQPEFDTDGNVIGHEYDTAYSFQVWKKKENLLRTFPNCKPVPYNTGDIEDPTIMDEEPEDNRKQFTVETTFTFRGTFSVKAENKREAIKLVEDCCGLVMGGSIHTNNDEDIVNWDFDMHPKKKVVSIM